MIMDDFIEEVIGLMIPHIYSLAPVFLHYLEEKGFSNELVEPATRNDPQYHMVIFVREKEHNLNGFFPRLFLNDMWQLKLSLDHFLHRNFPNLEQHWQQYYHLWPILAESVGAPGIAAEIREAANLLEDYFIHVVPAAV